MSTQNERRPGQGNGARNGREPVKSILSRNFARIVIGVTGVFGCLIMWHFSDMENAIIWGTAYSGMLIGFALGNIGGELR